MSSAQLEQHITLASQGVEELTAGLRRREVDLDALRVIAREGASPAVVLDQANDVAMRLQGHCTQVEQVGLHLRHAVTSAQEESWPAVEDATVALDSLQQVREHLQRAQHVMREVAAGESRSPSAATDAVRAAGQAAVHLRSGRSLTVKVSEMVGLTWAIGRETNYMQEPEIWERNDHWTAGTSRHAAPVASVRQAPVGPAR